MKGLFAAYDTIFGHTGALEITRGHISLFQFLSSWVTEHTEARECLRAGVWMCQPSPSPIPRMQVTLETNPIYRLLDLLFKHLVRKLNKSNLHFSVTSEHQIPTDVNAKPSCLKKTHLEATRFSRAFRACALLDNQRAPCLVNGYDSVLLPSRRVYSCRLVSSSLTAWETERNTSLSQTIALTVSERVWEGGGWMTPNRRPASVTLKDLASVLWCDWLCVQWVIQTLHKPKPLIYSLSL